MLIFNSTCSCWLSWRGRRGQRQLPLALLVACKSNSGYKSRLLRHDVRRAGSVLLHNQIRAHSRQTREVSLALMSLLLLLLLLQCLCMSNDASATTALQLLSCWWVHYTCLATRSSSYIFSLSSTSLHLLLLPEHSSWFNDKQLWVDTTFTHTHTPASWPLAVGC